MIATSVRAVIDTSVLVPARLRREPQQAAQLRAYTAIWSPWIIAELNRVLVWRWIKSPPAGAPSVVSENSHDYPSRQADGRHIYEGIEYLSGDAFLALLTGETG